MNKPNQQLEKDLDQELMKTQDMNKGSDVLGLRDFTWCDQVVERFVGLKICYTKMDRTVIYTLVFLSAVSFDLIYHRFIFPGV